MRSNHLTDYLFILLIVVAIAAGVRHFYQSALVDLTSGSIERATTQSDVLR
jgi:hypothetical protein